MTGLLDFLRGRQPLKRALWLYAVAYGTLLNLVATLAALAAAASGAGGAVVAAIFLAPLPYVAAAVVGVWRSSARDGVTAGEAGMARVLVMAWAVVMVLV